MSQKRCVAFVAFFVAASLPAVALANSPPPGMESDLELVGPAATVPTRTGKLRLGPYSESGGGGKSARVKLTLTPSPELVPFLNETRFVVTVEGTPQEQPDTYEVLEQGSERVLVATSSCDQPGLHLVRVQAEIAGIDTPLAAAVLDWDVSCSVPSSLSVEPVSIGGSPTADKGSVPTPAPVLPAGNTGSSPSESEAGQGCSVGASHTTSGALPLLAMLGCAGLAYSGRRWTRPSSKVKRSSGSN